MLPGVGTLPSYLYLLSFHPGKASSSIKSWLSLWALGNINDNQPTTFLIRIKYKPFLGKEARTGKTQQGRLVGPGPCARSMAECQSWARAWPLLAEHLWMSTLCSLDQLFSSVGESGARLD